ncbi:exported hypothetical protein [Tenacibaculum litopenaei]|uniref:immunoglobulin-like domain-containing protein n=1 Tax=Tenacibaculum litopenaei TaxID=396016 RepID=UPI0038956095
MKKRILVTVLMSLSFLSVVGQQTYVPDDQFEAYLEANGLGNGIANDNYVTTASIAAITSLDVSSQGISDMTGIADFSALQNLFCRDNSFSSLDVSSNTSLVKLTCHDNSSLTSLVLNNASLKHLQVENTTNLQNLNLTSLVSLEKLWVFNSGLTSLDVRKNTELKSLYAYDMALTTLDVSKNTKLTELTVQDTGLTSLDLSNNPLLKTLYASNCTLTEVNLEGTNALETLSLANNQLTSIDLTTSTSLKNLYLTTNKITRLDLKQNTNLFQVQVADNQLQLLDVRNGKNELIGTFDARANYDLTEVLVDDITMSSLVLWRVDGATYCLHCGETSVPDANFENYLETHDAAGNVVAVGALNSLGNGIANDAFIRTAAAAGVSQLNIAAQSIVNVTGLEIFTDVEKLFVHRNNIVSMELTTLTKLTEIFAYENKLTTLDLSANTALVKLILRDNELTAIDISQLSKLKMLTCQRNQLSSIDTQNNPELHTLSLAGNTAITGIDVSKNPKLYDLDISDTPITSVNLSQNPEMWYLYASNCKLTTIDLTSNTDLYELYLDGNAFTELDLSSFPNLEVVRCQNNALTSLNLRNGQAANLTDFDARNNPGLTCIAVNDATDAIARWTQVDGQTSFSTFCSATSVPDDNFEAYLETHTEGGAPVAFGDKTSMGNGIANDNLVGTERIQNIAILNISNQGITDFTGIEGFENLQRLTCSRNLVTSLDLSSNKKLEEIYCSDMGLEQLNIQGLQQVTRLVATNNALKNLNLSTNKKLAHASLHYNELTTLDVSENTELTDLRFTQNKLSSIDISANIKLMRLYATDNMLTTLDVSKNTALLTLSCERNPLNSLDVSVLSNLTSLFINGTQIASISLVTNSNLEEFGADNTALTTIDLSNSTKIDELYLNNTAITELDLSKLNLLEYFEGKDAKFEFVNLKNGNNSRDMEVYLTGNPNLSCIQVDDSTASYLSSWDKDVTASFANYCKTTHIPDTHFESLLESRGFGNGIANDQKVYTELIAAETTLIIQDTEIADLTGIEDFKNLEFLICRRSKLQTVDLSENLKLTILSLQDNELNALDLSKNTGLIRLITAENPLGSLDLSALSKLETLECRENSLTSLDLSKNTVLRSLLLGNNQLARLDLSAHPNLQQVQVEDNNLISLNIANGNNANLTSVNLSGNASLTCIQVDDDTAGYLSSWTKDDTASFSVDCVAPVITLIGDNPQYQNFGAVYRELGATTDDGSAVSIDDTAVNTQVLGVYDVRYNARDAHGNAAEELIRKVHVVAGPNQAIWTGASSTEWSNPNNWTGTAVPVATDEVIITNTLNKSVLSENAGSIKRIHLYAGASLEVTATGSLTVLETMNNEGEIRIASSKLSSGTLLVRGAASGQVTYERGGLLADNWHLVSSPVQGQRIASFVANLDNAIRTNSTVNPIRYAVATYDDQRSTGEKWQYYTAADLVSSSLQFEVGKGYTASRETDGKLHFTGSLTTGNHNVAVNGSSWRALGNPYTAYYPVNSPVGETFLSTNVGELDPVYQAVYTWDSTQQKYIPNSGVTAEKYLAPGQAFFVKTATGANNLQFQEALRKSIPLVGSSFQRSSLPTIQLKLVSNKREVFTAFLFHERGTLDLDPGYDLGNFNGADFDVFSHLPREISGADIGFAVQSLSDDWKVKKVLPITVINKTHHSGSIEFTAKNIPPNTAIQLFNPTSGSYLSLPAAGVKHIDLKDLTCNPCELELHIGGRDVALSEPEVSELQLIHKLNSIVITGADSGELEWRLYALSGAQIARNTQTVAAENTVVLPKLASGVYLFNITTKHQTKTLKIHIK